MTHAIAPAELIAANEAAATYYRQMLLGPDGEGPRTYLSSRGFPTLFQDTPWTVGYAPAEWTKGLDHLRDQGFDDSTLTQAGIASVTRCGSLIDRFRDRLVFGIRDPAGRLVAFLGRAAPSAQTGSPKYLGTPSSRIYRKGDLLFGFHEQHDPLHAHGTTVIVEGPFDAIAVSQSTDSVGLALCGTAMTLAHATLLAKAAESVVLCLDRDPAGQAATVRSSLLMWERKLSVTVAQLPEASDPASITQTKLVHALRSAIPAEKAVVKAVLDGRPGLADNVEAQLAALRHAARVLATAPPPNKALAATELVHGTHLGHDVVTAHLAAAISSGNNATEYFGTPAYRMSRSMEISKRR